MSRSTKSIRILGIDPGSRQTGFGCVDLVGHRFHHVTHGTLRLSTLSGKSTVPLEQRLLLLYQELTRVIVEFRPQVMAIEKVFFAKNAVSALKLGQARGAAIVTGAIQGLEIVEYSPTQVKASLSGYGRADKEQIARMVQVLVGKKEFDSPDASDGLALAICHAQNLIGGKSRELMDLQSPRSSGGKKRSGSLADALGLRIGPKGEVQRS